MQVCVCVCVCVWGGGGGGGGYLIMNFCNTAKLCFHFKSFLDTEKKNFTEDDSNIHIIMAADGMATQEAGTSVAMVMMTSSAGNIFRVTGPLCGEFTGEFPAQRASDAEVWCFLLSAPEQMVE